MYTIAVPPDRRSCSTAKRRSASLEPRLAVGSSSTSSRAFIERARAIATNCCCAGDKPPHEGARRDLRTDAGELPLRVCLHAPAIEQTQRPCPLRLAAEEDVAGDVERLDDLALLMDDADAETSRVRRSVHRHWHTLERDRARVSPMDAAENLHQRRLARAVLADEADDFSSRHVEVHAIEGDDAGKSLGHRRHVQERIGRQWRAPA